MNAKEMAGLFNEVEVGAFDGVKSNGELRPFEARVEDVQAVMDNELPCDDTEIIEDAVQAAAEAPPPPPTNLDEDVFETKTDYVDQVEADMKEFETDDDPEPEPEPVQNEPEEVEEVKNEPEAEEEIPDKKKEAVNENPLDLSSPDLQAFNSVKIHFPQFVLYDGSVSFKDFYRYKFKVLNSAVNRFAILDLKQMGEEIGDLKLDHFIGERSISPELLRRRLDDAYRYRVRLSVIMIQLFGQYPWWERNCELLKSKLWKDHELKGTHRRDGLTMEHMADVEDYLHYMKGIMDAAKHADGMLKAATESLSRQLSCLQIGKEATGFTTSEPTVEHIAEPIVESKPEVQSNYSSSVLDGLDSIEESNVIKAPVVSSNADSILSAGDDEW